MKKFVIWTLAVLLVAALVAAVLSLTVFGVSQDANGVYSVGNSNDLTEVFSGIENGSISASAKIKLTADINVDGKLAMLNKTFTGTFDGNGKTISGLSSTMFKQFNGTVTNLTLRGDIDARNFSDSDAVRKAASFALNTNGGVFTNLISYVNVTTSASDLNAGGLVGYANVSAFNYCQYLGNYTVAWTGSNAGIGGIVGFNNAGGDVTTFVGCRFGGTITVTGGVAGNFAYIGGIVGNCTQPQVTLRNCTSAGTILSQITAGDDYVGGIAGVSQNMAATIEYCANKSNVTAKSYAGGILGGITAETTVSFCSNFGTITAGTGAGLFGGTSNKNVFKFESCVDFSGSTLSYGTGGKIQSQNSYRGSSVVDLNESFTVGDLEYKRYNVCVVEVESGILAPVLSTDGNTIFKAYVSLRDDGSTHAVRFVIVTKYDLIIDPVTVSISFKDENAKTVKHLDMKLAAYDSDITLYSAVSADGNNYFAAADHALFGCIIKDIPMASWDTVELTIRDTADGTVLLAPVSFTLPVSYISLSDLPSYSSLGTVASNVYNCGPGLMSDQNGVTEEDASMVVIRSSSAAKLASYVETLKQQGFGLISQNTVDGDTYYTLRRYSSLVYLYYNAGVGETRIILDNASDPLSKIAYDYTKKAGDTTAFYQYSINYVEAGVTYSDPDVAMDCGMLYVIKLPDNKLVVIDSGHTGQWPASAKDPFMNFLREITGTPQNEKVEIAMWFFTHAHGDHVGFAHDFLKNYRNSIDLESVTFNFPSYQVISDDYDSNTFTLKNVLNTYYPNVNYHKLHTGEQFSLAGVDFEVVYTHEDAVSTSGKTEIDGFNGTSTVMKITMDGKTIMILGDSDNVTAKVIDAVHSDTYMKSDIVQASHHGYNEVLTSTSIFNKKSLYSQINASIAVVPNSQKKGSTGSGYKNYLKNKQVYFADTYTYKFTVVNGEIKVEALTRYDQ